MFRGGDTLWDTLGDLTHYSFIGRETIGQWCIGFLWVKSWKVEFVAMETKSQDKPRQLTIRACFYSQIQN